MTPCSPAFWPCPRWRRRIPCCSTTAWGASPTPPASSPPSGRGARRSACPAVCRAMAWRPGLVRPDSALIPHPYGMLEPGEDCPLVGKDAIGLVLVPGLAFDPSGGRLGQGGGFYDRWLADYAGCTAALCRTALLLPQVPRAPHDRGWSWCSPSTACTGRMRRGAGPKGPAPRRTVRKRLSSSRRCTRSCCCSHSCSRSHCRPSFRRSSSKG